MVLVCLAVLFVLGMSQSALAGGTDPCPAVGDNAAGTCNVIITINADGSITTSNGSATQPYDNVVKAGLGEDVTVGVINNSANAVLAFTVTGAPTGGDFGPFNFDETTALDGPCDPFLGTTAAGCPSGESSGSAFGFGALDCTNATGYEGPMNCFSNFSTFTTGTVNFLNGGLAAGDSTWFALEAPAGLNLTVTPTPEPASLLLLASGLGLFMLVRRALA
jgi:hypothetical protein